MKVGKSVWVVKKGVAVEAKLVTFGKGPMATVEYRDGRQEDVYKERLSTKRPGGGR